MSCEEEEEGGGPMGGDVARGPGGPTVMAEGVGGRLGDFFNSGGVGLLCFLGWESGEGWR